MGSHGQIRLRRLGIQHRTHFHRGPMMSGTLLWQELYLGKTLFSSESDTSCNIHWKKGSSKLFICSSQLGQLEFHMDNEVSTISVINSYNKGQNRSITNIRRVQYLHPKHVDGGNIPSISIHMISGRPHEWVGRLSCDFKPGGVAFSSRCSSFTHFHVK